MRIGIVIPAYNAARWIGDAIASVIAQTHQDWAMVVVDDGSTDATAQAVESFSDRRIGLVRQANAGVSAARNRGIAELRLFPLSREAGEGGVGVAALLFLDADDRLSPDALSRLADALDASPEAVAAAGGFAFVDRGGGRGPPSGDILERLLVRNLFANGGHLLLRRAAVQTAGDLLPNLAYGEDWEFWIRIALQGPFAAASGATPVLFVSQHPSGTYHRLACDPSAFVPCMDAIFGNPALLSRFGATRLAAIRRRTEAENHWIIGRELIRHARAGEGRLWLRRSVRSNPSAKRIAMLAATQLLPLLPRRLRGPFRPYHGCTTIPVSR